MVYAVFSVKKENIGKIENVLKDDLVSRQSIVIRDASTLGFNKEVRFVLIEGTNEAIEKAVEIFKGVGEREKEGEAKNIYSKFKEQEETVASGVGLIFG